MQIVFIKKYKKYSDFENIPEAFLDHRIHNLITEGKIIIKIFRNVNSYRPIFLHTHNSNSNSKH